MDTHRGFKMKEEINKFYYNHLIHPHKNTPQNKFQVHFHGDSLLNLVVTSGKVIFLASST